MKPGTMNRMTLTFKNDWGIGTDQHGASSGAASRSGRTLGVDSDVTGKDDGVPSIPGRGLDPVNGVENSGGGAITGVLAVDALDIIVARLCEKVHQSSLY